MAVARRSGTRGVLIDLGGVLVPGLWPEASRVWCDRLAIANAEFLAALFSGNDDTVLIGKVSEDDWWDVVRGRLSLDREQTEALRSDLEGDETWDDQLVACLRMIRPMARTGILSNTWSGTRARIERCGYGDLVHEVVLSAEVGSAKPDPAIYESALARLALPPAAVIFIDDTLENVLVAEDLGMTVVHHRNTRETIAAIEQFVANR